MSTQSEIAQVLAWADAEFKRRTEAIESGEINIDWLEPRTRVCVSEIMAYADRAGIKVDRLDLQRALVKRERRPWGNL